MRMKKKEIETAVYLLSKSGLELCDAARLALELAETCRTSGPGRDLFDRCRRAIGLGARALREEESSVSFTKAVEQTLKVKQHRAERTQRDIAYYMRRRMRKGGG